jgi:CRISPR/Cas system-associated endoribonuclease Cas2
MNEALPAGGNILLYFKVQDHDSRKRLRHLLENLPSERVTSSLYEVSTADWDEGLWDETVEKMEELIDPAVDSLIFWQISEGKLLRTTIAGRHA